MAKKQVWSLFGACFLIILLCSAANAQDKPDGNASYYSKRLHGHKTSSGERHDAYGFHCAHRTLPFGSMIKVTNLVNNRSTIVRVNDRGPFGAGRCVDLSIAAAKELRMVGRGVAPVKMEVVYQPLMAMNSGLNTLKDSTDSSDGDMDFAGYQYLQQSVYAQHRYFNASGQGLDPSGYGLHADNFGVLDNALDAARALEDHGFNPVIIEPRHDKGMLYYRVLVGQYADKKETKKAARKLADLGHSALLLKYKSDDQLLAKAIKQAARKSGKAERKKRA